MTLENVKFGPQDQLYSLLITVMLLLHRERNRAICLLYANTNEFFNWV